MCFSPFRIGILLFGLTLNGCVIQQNQETIDLTSVDEKALQVVHVSTVQADILAIEIETADITRGQQIPYKATFNDRIIERGKDIWLQRGGLHLGLLSLGMQDVGVLIGNNHDILYTLDRYRGENLHIKQAEQALNYRILSEQDERYQHGIPPDAVFRKSKPTGMARIGSWEFAWPLKHTLYLDLPYNLRQDTTYQIQILNQNLHQQLRDITGSAPVQDNPTVLNCCENSYSSSVDRSLEIQENERSNQQFVQPAKENIATLTFDYQPDLMRSEAVHVSHFGFRPDDPAKVGFLSTWMGKSGGIQYSEDMQFWLMEQNTNAQVYAGIVQLAKAYPELEDPYRNYSGTDVYWMDFSDFNRIGKYRLCVETIGCSFPFAIDRQVWQNPFYVSARGFYHQRSGIALEQPYTTFERPRSFHPQDGNIIYHSTVRLIDTQASFNRDGLDPFKALIETRTEQTLPNAWGGYFDAGDWDRNIRHLEVARSLLELAELFPDYFGQFSLNIPESNNALADIVDEALWGIDFFHRLQHESGGISGGIESAGTPKLGEASWQESHIIMAYAPDLWSSYIYAGVAARAAHWLKVHAPQFSDLANIYQESALRAMHYAEQEFARELTETDIQNRTQSAPNVDRKTQFQQHQNTQYQRTNLFAHPVHDERNLAALELFRLTRDPQWHQLFLQTTAFNDPTNPVFEHGQHNQRHAAFIYAKLQKVPDDTTIQTIIPDPIQASIQANAHNALIREADELSVWQQKTAFKWSKTHPYVPVFWSGGLGTPQAQAFLRAHGLTQQTQYLKAAVLAAQFSAGANADNMVYTTGLGYRSPQHPLVVDARIIGKEPPPGITVYGPADPEKIGEFWFFDLFESVTTPEPLQWPTTEAYFDVYWLIPVNEFTIFQTMAPTAYTWGYLTAREAIQ